MTVNVDPSCGKCGYCVRGLETPICPECGSDLRLVGTTIPGQRRKTLFVGWIKWTLALASPAIFISYLLYQFLLPSLQIQTVWRNIQCQYPQLNATIQVTRMSRTYVRGNAFDPNRRLPAKWIILQIGHARESFWYDLDAGRWNYSLPGGISIQGPGRLTQQTLLRWLKDNGFDSSDPFVQQGATDILVCINEMPDHSAGYTQFAVNGNVSNIITHPSFTSYSRSPMAIEIPGLVALWILIWAAGIAFIAKRSKMRVAA